MNVVLGSPPWEFVKVEPLYPAFARMVRGLEFEVCEMAVATFLQAREAGVPITLLPLVTVGGTHHGSLTQLPATGLRPEDLRGRRVGVRSYSQTTGLWVRGILREEYGIEPADITWVTTEEPHVAQYREPAFVQRSTTAATVADLLRSGEVDAAVLGPRAVGGQGAGLVPVIPDVDTAADAWVERHGTVPVNHMVVVRDDVLRRDPEPVYALYRALRDTTEWRTSLRVAAGYALDQDLVRDPVDVDAIIAEATVFEKEATAS